VPLPRVAIVVPSLAARGGLPALAFFLHRTLLASGRYEPSLISLATSANDEDSVRLVRPATWRRGVQTTSRDIGGIPYVHVGAVGTEIEILRYQPRGALTRLLNSFDIVQLVGGSPALAHVARDVRRPVALYVATLVRAERQALLRERGLTTQWRRLMTALVDRMDVSGLKYADVVFVINAWMHRHVANALGPDRVHLSPPGIDTAIFTPGPIESHTTVLTVGRLDDPRKNIVMLVEAFAKLRSRLPNVRLVLAGERAPDHRVLARSRALEIADALEVRLKLSAQELAALYQSAAVFALSSDEEGLGIAALEAMSCAVPVVATRCGGPELTVVDGETGFLVPVGDVDAFSARLEVLLSDPDLRRRMGSASRARVEERFSVERTGDVFIRAYDELLSPAAGRKESPKALIPS
jgi:glycosyltransferase involved in cell wall biosynthesis